MKDCYYFSHDSNAKDDPKCIMLIEQLGLEGYGIFWILVEMLRDQPDHKYPLSLVPAIARRFNTTTEKVNVVIKNYDLFVIENNEFFYSESLNLRMQIRDEKRQKLSDGGKKGMAQRYENQPSDNLVITSLEPGYNKERKGKETKGKERKVNKSVYGTFENVKLTPEEHQKLLAEYGEDKAIKIIEFLSLYREEKGYKNKSDYLSIKRWVVKAVEERNNKSGNPFKDALRKEIEDDEQRSKNGDGNNKDSLSLLLSESEFN